MRGDSRPAALPTGLSDFARQVLGKHWVRWEPKRPSGEALDTTSVDPLIISSAEGRELLRVNTGDFPEATRRAEGLAIAYLRRLEFAVGIGFAAPEPCGCFAQPQWCYLRDDGVVLLEVRSKVDAGLPRDPRPWLPPDRPLHPYASSVLKLVEKLAFFLDAGERGHNRMVVRVGAREGESLARLLGAAEVREPSDDVHRFWRGAGFTLHDGELYGRNADECWAWLGAEATSTLPAIVRFASRAGASLQIAVQRFERTEAREFSEAPSLERVTMSGGAVRVSCPYGTEHEAQMGDILLEETSEGPLVHQVRVVGGRIATWERYGGRGPELTDHCLAVDHFRGVLSPRCLEWARRYNVMHYPWVRASESELRAAFERRGLELTDAHVDLERMLGGLVVRGAKGVYAQGFGLGLHAERLREFVVSTTTSASLDADLTVGPDGTLTGGELTEGSCPLARSWRQYLERLAIGYDGIERQSARTGDLGIGRGRCSVLFTETIGPELARLLEIPESPLLSDDLTFFAEDADSLIWCPFSAAEHDLLLDSYATELVTTNLDRVVDALRVAARCSTTVEFHLDGPADREEEHERPVLPPAELLVGAERFSLSTGRVVRGTAYVVGSPRNYRIEVVTDGPNRQAWRTFTPERNTLRWYQHR